MNQEQAHLNIEQVECLIEMEPAEQGSDAKSAFLDEARKHLADCDACQRLVSVHRDGDRLLRRLRPEYSAQSTMECPSEAVLYQLAGRTMGVEESERILKHAIQCDHCSPLLRLAAEVLNSDLTIDEVTFRSSLRTASGEWQQDFAKKLASQNTSGTSGSRIRGLRDLLTLTWIAPTIRWTGAVIALLFLIAIATRFIQWRSSPAYADQMLAQAYFEHRTLELRFPGASYAPVRVTRGPAGSSVEKPPALNEVEAVIGKKLAKNPNDPDWLQAKARADLLDGNYESSITSLKSALDARPGSPSLFADLGAAYFQRARPGDDATSFEYLSKALAKTPDDPIVVFNRAIVGAHLHLYTEAIDDWHHYLQLDPVGPWADDAREHLQALGAGSRLREQRLAEPLLEPPEFVSVDSENIRFEDEVDARIEDYLSVAVRDWLPQAYIRSTEKLEGKTSLQIGLRFLSELASKRHGDRWLADLLAHSHGDSFPLAVTALASSVRASDAGDYQAALQQARQSALLFEASGNAAGVLRANVETIYALHLLRRGDQCLQAVEATDGSVEKSAYRWLQIQFRIEQATCLSIMGNLGGSERIIMQGLRLAQASGYKTIYLRAIGLASDTNAAKGNVSIAWKQASDGLDRFWSGNYPSMAGYNLYTNMDVLADASQQPQLQVAIWRQALALIDTDQDLRQRAMAHSWLANAAFMADMPRLAEQEFAAASRLFEMAPPGEAVFNARAEAQVWLARLEGQRGSVDPALARLEGLAPYFRHVSNNYDSIYFYTTLGGLLLQRGRNGEAENALRSAVALAEWSLHSLTSDQERITWNRDASEAYRALAQLKLLQGNALESLEVWEWYRGASVRHSAMRVPDALSIANEPTLPTLDVVSKRLPTLTRQTVISFSFLAEGLAVWICDNRGISGKILSTPKATVLELAQRFKELTSNPGSDVQALHRDSRRLYDVLIAPLEARLAPDRELVIETDGTLSGIPMEALLDSQSLYLGETRAISTSPGLYYTRKPNPGPRLSPDSLGLLVAVPSSANDAGKGLIPLSNAIQEVETVAKHFRNVRLLEGDIATPYEVKRNLADVVFFHFAGHGLASPDAAGLVLADDPKSENNIGLLNARNIDPKQLRAAQLVVLSACTTENGLGSMSSDPDSLVRIFLQAGVPDIIASRWSVDSAVTSEFMGNFYRIILSGKTAAESLREAESEIRQRSETSHPYYWAAFSTFGLS